MSAIGTIAGVTQQVCDKDFGTGDSFTFQGEDTVVVCEDTSA